jgi:hypothetical protein
MSLEVLSSQGCDHLSCKAYLADKLQRDAHHGASATRNNFHTRMEAFTEVDKLERLSSCANNLRLDAAKDEFGTPVADLEAAARRCPVSTAIKASVFCNFAALCVCSCCSVRSSTCSKSPS